MRRMAGSADRVPVIVAVGQAIERDAAVTAIDLLERAARAALDTVPRLGGIDRLSVVGVLSPVGPAPASELAARLGIDPPVRETTTIGGNTPQWLVTRAAADIARGRLGTTLIAGAEALRSAKLRQHDQRPPAGGPAADPVVGDARPGVGAAELQAGLVLPVHLYALLESAIAASAGRKPADHRAVLGELVARFTTVAATHPFAWFPEARPAVEISQPGDGNRLVAEPYTKRMCAYLDVDQGAAVVVTSLAAARRAGVADRAVFIWSGADAADVWFPSARPRLWSSPGIAAAAHASLAAAGVGVDDIAAFDLYSCFPAPVEMACEALGLAGDDLRGLTVTGGLAAFGGPGNNYTSHAIATMVERLRDRGGLGLVGGLGWYVTKHAYGVYGADPPPQGFRRADTSRAQADIDASALEVVTDRLEGASRATVEASTVVYDRSGSPNAAPVIARLDDGRRIVAAAASEELDVLSGRSLVGARIHIAGWPPTYRVEEP